MEISRFLTLLVSTALLLGMGVATTGCLEKLPDGEELTTGTIEVIYQSGPNGEDEVVIYLESSYDTERLGRIPSDAWRTFEDIEPGSYIIFARNLDGLLLDSRGIDVHEGGTTTVELGW
ncbi:MAG: hypothetical protein ACOCSJ_02180 [Candidatus Natronoplasma sp.]